MPRQVIIISVGGCGARISDAAWSQLSREHRIQPDGRRINTGTPRGNGGETVSATFEESKDGSCTARSVMVDLNIDEIESIINSTSVPYRYQAAVCGGFDAAHSFGKALKECEHIWPNVMDEIRHGAEACDSLKLCQIASAISGGTGSAVNTRLLQHLSDDFSHVFRQQVVVIPPHEKMSLNGVYNSLFATSGMNRHAHQILCLETNRIARCSNQIWDEYGVNAQNRCIGSIVAAQSAPYRMNCMNGRYAEQTSWILNDGLSDKLKFHVAGACGIISNHPHPHTAMKSYWGAVYDTMRRRPQSCCAAGDGIMLNGVGMFAGRYHNSYQIFSQLFNGDIPHPLTQISVRGTQMDSLFIGMHHDSSVVNPIQALHRLGLKAYDRRASMHHFVSDDSAIEIDDFAKAFDDSATVCEAYFEAERARLRTTIDV